MPRGLAFHTELASPAGLATLKDMNAPRAGRTRDPKRPSARSCGPATAWTLVLSLSGCIQVNEDFDSPLKLAREAHVHEPGAATSNGLLSTIDGSPSDQGTSSSGEDELALSDASGSSLSTSWTNRSSEPLTSASSTSSSSTSSSSTPSSSSSSSSAPPRGRAIPIHLSNDDRSNAVPAQGSIRLQLDHRSMVLAGAAEDGSDLRIFYTPPGGSRREIHRILDPSTSWNSPSTALWFANGAPLTASQKELNGYELVIEDAASVPLANPSGVFLLYDGFDGGALDTQKWSSDRGGGAGSTASVSVQGGTLTLDAACVGSQNCSRYLRSNESWQTSGLIFESSMRVSGRGADCTREYIHGFWSPLPSTFIRAAWVQRQQGYSFANHSDNGPFNLRPMLGQRSPASFSRYRSEWRGSQVSMYRDGSLIDRKTPFDTSFQRPDHGRIIVGMEAFASGAACAGARSLIEVDWAAVYFAASTQVSTQLRYDQERELP